VKQVTKHRTNEEKLKRMRVGSRYFGFNLAQFYWECLKLAAASEQLRETDILRRIIRSWSETLPPTIQEKARAETTRVEAWKALAQAAIARQTG
jgi:CHAD domain-containing protein